MSVVRVRAGEPEYPARFYENGLFLFRRSMPFWVYIIQSETTGRYYCGQSSDVERRLRQHNDPEYRLSKTTKRLEGPWKLVWTQKTSSRAEAMTMEKKLKREVLIVT